MFAVMQCIGLQFESLPSELLKSPYMTLDLLSNSNSNTNTAERSPSPVPIPTPAEQRQKLDELRTNRSQFHEKRMAKKMNAEFKGKCNLMKNRMIEVNDERMLKMIKEGKADDIMKRMDENIFDIMSLFPKDYQFYVFPTRCLVVLTTDGQHTSCLSGCGCLNWRHETVSNLKISKNLKFQDFKILDLKAHQVVNLPQPTIKLQ